MGRDHTLHGHRLASLLYFDHMHASLARTKSLYLFSSCRHSPQWVHHCTDSAVCF